MDNEKKEPTENEKKKQYLRQYRVHVRRIKRIEAELSELRLLKVCPSVNNDGMPHNGGGQNDLSGYAGDVDELENDLRTERCWRIKAYKEIVRQIKRLKNENEIDVLFYRYIKGLDWWDIADKMHYSERWVHKLHGRALAHFQLPKEFIEVQ